MEPKDLYDIGRKLERIELSIYGNGVEGIITRLRTLEKSSKEIEDKIDLILNEKTTLLNTIKYLVGLTIAIVTIGIAYATLIK